MKEALSHAKLQQDRMQRVNTRGTIGHRWMQPLRRQRPTEKAAASSPDIVRTGAENRRPRQTRSATAVRI